MMAEVIEENTALEVHNIIGDTTQNTTTTNNQMPDAQLDVDIFGSKWTALSQYIQFFDKFNYLKVPVQGVLW